LLFGAGFAAPGFFTSYAHGPRGSKQIALTLDDGPNPPYTEMFLRLLEAEKIPATFFMLGRNIEMHRLSALRVVAAGHEVGNHSFSHSAMAWARPVRTVDEITKTDALIRGLGYEAAIPFRAPFGERFGLHAWILLWMRRPNTLYDVAPVPPDYFRNDPQAMADSAVARAQNGSIVLFHDGEGIRVESLEATARVVRRLKANGFTFVRLSELLAGQATK
jgi:peptidoglycan/xylan/chitin deacetylase (PgdA/CDA1 family)